ncbi:MAG: hypothetical protein QOH95_2175 [Gaiellaceae bacterium]|nr:hypothetical protein [Gaiellaceae bacterium]
MQEPGLDEHEWIGEWEDIDLLLKESPTEALSEADDLIARMMQTRGFPLQEREGEELTEPETTRSFIEARRVTRQIDSGESFDPGDVALAVEAYRELYDYLLHLGPTSGTPA